VVLAFAGYLLGVNLWAFVAFWADKRASVLGLRRTPERALLALALIGGTPGAIAAQQLVRHKTRKEPFRSLLWGIAAAQGLLLAWLYARALSAR
jgi:uncharacterized membrane protein YsdA (DUF1294 family)